MAEEVGFWCAHSRSKNRSGPTFTTTHSMYVTAIHPLFFKSQQHSLCNLLHISHFPSPPNLSYTRTHSRTHTHQTKINVNTTLGNTAFFLSICSWHQKTARKNSVFDISMLTILSNINIFNSNTNFFLKVDLYILLI